MKVLGKVLKALNRSESIKKGVSSNSTSIFNNATSNMTNARKAVKVSDAEIEQLMSQGVIPMKYTAKDIVTIAARKIFAPIKSLYRAVSYVVQSKFTKIPLETPVTKVLEKDLPDCLKGKI